MINGVKTSQAATPKAESTRKKEVANTISRSSAEPQNAAAVLELGKSAQEMGVTYNKPTTPTKKSVEDDKSAAEMNANEVNRLWEQANRATQNLRDMVESLLKSQGKTFKDVLSGKEELIVDEKTKAAAVQAISEDGECGVQAVSDRIVAFAKALSNDNPEMYDKLMSAIDEGFAQAEKALGGELPEICKKTREEVNRKMEEWKTGK